MTSRLLVLGGFLAIAGLAWIFLFQSEIAMTTMARDHWLAGMMMAMMQPHAATLYLTATAAMWLVMMIAMMTPAVLPVVLMFTRVDRGNAAHRTRDSALFGASYLVVWGIFGIAMAVLQWGLHRGAVLQTHLLEAGPVFASSLAIAAGFYQLTPLKSTCLSHCQSPLGFLMSHWRAGALGAIHMGFTHGAYCLGCCWALMFLMFVGGVMSVGAMVVISLYILFERLLPAGPWMTKFPGALLIGWGVWTLIAQL
jgi:predicted metal-binding membrane protein